MHHAICTTIRRDRGSNVWLIRAACPFCSAEHRHGGNTDAVPSLGFRSSDCGGGDYDLLVTDATVIDDRRAQ